MRARACVRNRAARLTDFKIEIGFNSQDDEEKKGTSLMSIFLLRALKLCASIILRLFLLQNAKCESLALYSIIVV